MPTIGEITTPGCLAGSIGAGGGFARPAAAPAGRRAPRPARAANAAARDADALAVLLDFDFGQAGLVQKLGQLVDQVAVDDRCFRRFCHRAFAGAHSFALAPISAGEAGDRQRVAVDAEAGDHRLRRLRDIGIVPEFFARDGYW